MAALPHACPQHPPAGDSMRAELVGAAAASLGDSALEGWCFGVFMGSLGVACKGAAGTCWQRWEAQAVDEGQECCRRSG